MKMPYMCITENILYSLPQAGLRQLQDLGPEIRRAISGDLEEDTFPTEPEPMHRVSAVTGVV